MVDGTESAASEHLDCKVVRHTVSHTLQRTHRVAVVDCLHLITLVALVALEALLVQLVPVRVLFDLVVVVDIQYD